MLTVAVANVEDSSEQALQFIEETSFKKGIKTCSIAPIDTTIYKKNKKIHLKQYVEQISKGNNIDLLIVQLNKAALEKQIYGNIEFDIAVLFNSMTHNKRLDYKSAHLSHKYMHDIKASYYIIPETCKHHTQGYITYGWGKQADITASSVETNLEGGVSLQCCIQNIIPSLKGDIKVPSEFCVDSRLDNVEGMLAGVATMLLYGINVEQ